MLHIKIPATTANMGPGFDCIGMALQLYNNAAFQIMDENDPRDLVIESRNRFEIPFDKSNMIYQAFAGFYAEAGIAPIPRIRIIQEDSIPMTRGLGSSAACIVAGLLAANEISKAGMSREELAFLSAKIEGHPDNSVPAILGGMIVGVLTDKKLEYSKISGPHLDRLKFAVMVPAFALSTAKARGILPRKYAMGDSIFNTSRAALMVAAILSGDLEKLGVAMDDRIHQPYRSKIIPDMDGIFVEAKRLGAKGVFLSGAGPTIISVLDGNADCEPFKDAMGRYLSALPDSWDLNFIAPDHNGAEIYRSRMEE